MCVACACRAIPGRSAKSASFLQRFEVTLSDTIRRPCPPSRETTSTCRATARRWSSRTASAATSTCGACWRRTSPSATAGVLLDLVGSGNSDLSAYDRQKYGTLQGYADDVLRDAGRIRRRRPVDLRRPLGQRDDRHAGQPEAPGPVRRAGHGRPVALLHQRRRLRRRLRARRTSSRCSRRWRATTWAGPATWRRPSWARPTSRSSAWS